MAPLPRMNVGFGALVVSLLCLPGFATAAPGEDRLDRWMKEAGPPPAPVNVYVDKLVLLARAAGLELVPDDALTVGARLYARHAVDAYPGYRNDPVVSDLFFERAGSPAHHIWRYAIGPVEAEAIQRMEPYQLVMKMKKHATAQRVAFGVGWAEGPPSFVAFAFSNLEATLDVPLPTRAKKGDRVTLKGRLSPGFASPVLLLEVPGKGVEHRELGPGPTFKTEVLLDRAGLWRLELVGTGSYGPIPVLNATILADVPPPPLEPSRLPFTGSEQDAEALMLAGLNTRRAASGLGALRPDPRAAAVVRAHCHDMFVNDFFGHRSPTTGGPGDRLARVQYKVLGWGENLATSRGPEDAQRSLERSPGHLGAMLQPSFTQVGIAAVKNTRPDGPPWCFGQLFVTTDPPAPAGTPRPAPPPTPTLVVTEPPSPPTAALDVLYARFWKAVHALSVGAELKRLDPVRVEVTVPTDPDDPLLVSLANLHAHCAVSEEACAKEVAFLAAAVKSETKRWAIDAFPLLLRRAQLPTPKPDAAKVVAVPLLGDLLVTYWQRTWVGGFVDDDLRERLALTHQHLHENALESARRHALSLRVRLDAASGSAAISADEGESSGLLLLEDRVFPLLPFKPTRACVPSRHVLLFADGTKDASFDALCRIVHDEEAYPLSPLVFRRGDFGWTR